MLATEEALAVTSPEVFSRSFGLTSRHLRSASQPANSPVIWRFADSLKDGESFWLEFQKLDGGKPILEFSSGATLQEAVAADDFRHVLELAFPGFDVASRPEPSPKLFPDLQAVPLRALPVVVSDSRGVPDPRLLVDGPKSQGESQAVYLGACNAEEALSEALLLLVASKAKARFRLTLASRRLNSNELRRLSSVYRDLIESRGRWFRSSFELERIATVTSLMEEWLAANIGVELSLSVGPGLAAFDPLPYSLATFFSLPPAARREAENGDLDLSGCFVRGQKRPALRISNIVRQQCSFVGHGQGREPLPGAFLGRDSAGLEVLLGDAARSRHVLICGATGTGKSTLIRNMIADDVQRGHGVILIDPHGDLYEDVLEIVGLYPDIPVWCADTADHENRYVLNLLQSANDSYRRNFICNQLIRILKHSLYKDVPEGFGPMFEAYFRNAFLLLTDGGAGRYAIGDMDRVFADAKFRRELLEGCSDAQVARFWRGIAVKAGGEASLENIAPYIVSKLTQIVGNPVISPILCGRDSTLDFNEILDSGGVCLVNLAKGQVGETEAEILGSIFSSALFSAALARGRRSRTDRSAVRVYLDEFQSYAGEVVAEILAECRKYGLEMTLATQSLNRLKHINGNLAQSILGNTGNIVAMRSGPYDADLLADWIGGDIARRDIMSLADFNAIGRFLDSGQVSHPAHFRLEKRGGSGHRTQESRGLSGTEAPF